MASEAPRQHRAPRVICPRCRRVVSTQKDFDGNYTWTTAHRCVFTDGDGHQTWLGSLCALYHRLAVVRRGDIMRRGQMR